MAEGTDGEPGDNWADRVRTGSTSVVAARGSDLDHATARAIRFTGPGVLVTFLALDAGAIVTVAITAVLAALWLMDFVTPGPQPRRRLRFTSARPGRRMLPSAVQPRITPTTHRR